MLLFQFSTKKLLNVYFQEILSHYFFYISNNDILIISKPFDKSALHCSAEWRNIWIRSYIGEVIAMFNLENLMYTEELLYNLQCSFVYRLYCAYRNMIVFSCYYSFQCIVFFEKKSIYFLMLLFIIYLRSSLMNTVILVV